MPVPSVHRFLYGRTPRTADRRLWVLSGQIQDWFFHDLLNGCVDVRRTLELWALQDGMELTVTLTRAGTLDFGGNADPVEAQARFEGTRTRRPSPYSQRPPANPVATARSTADPDARVGTSTPTCTGTEPVAPSTSSSQPQTDEAVEARARQSVDQVQQAAGGAGQALLNTIGRLTHLLKSKQLRSLVIIEDLVELISRLASNQATAPLADDLQRIVRNDWHGSISPHNLLIFLTLDSRRMTSILPESTFKKVEWRELPGPKEEEIRAALERLARRHGLRLHGAGPMAKTLTRHENLQVALGNVFRVIGSGQRDVTLERILQLPPLNEAEIARVKRELDELTGLHEVKEKVAKLERKARLLRQKLLDGESHLPEESMHLVFTGSAGTGKTTVATIIARIFHALGILRRDDVRTVTASEVMSSNVNESLENMARILEESRGGVLFIDEAHDFGDKESMGAKEAIRALVPAAWNYRHELVIILGGYARQMPDFFNMNEGLNRRFRPDNRIEFRDYTLPELLEMLYRKFRAHQLTAEENVRVRLNGILARRMRRRDFGNAGGVDLLVQEVVERHASSGQPTSRTITLGDLPPLVRRDEMVFREAMMEIEAMVGLEPVRTRIASLINRIQYDLEEEDQGAGTGQITLHPGNMLFTGPPGTGKSTVGRVIAKLLYGIGCTERAYAQEATRGSLVAGFQGQTGIRVREVVDKARGGVLFIDEAYALVSGPGDDFGRQALDELVSQIQNEDNRDTVFILAGYRDRMHTLLQTNEGLTRRFPIEIQFPNFPPEACGELARRRLQGQRLMWEDGVLECIQALAEEAIEAQGSSFGNAGWLNTLVDELIGRMKDRVMRDGIPSGDPNRRKVLRVDLPALARSTEALVDRPELTMPGDTAADQAGAGWTPAMTGLGWTLPVISAEPLRSSRAAPEPAELEALGREIEAASFQIYVTEADSGGRRATGMATGFFVTPDGVMVTSAHAVQGATAIQVLCGRNRAPRAAQLLECSPDLDLALLAVDVEASRPHLLLGSSHSLRPPAELLVYGHAHVRPGEPGRLLMARVARNDERNPRGFKTDGAIETGFSGGPAVDRASGAAVGVVKGCFGPSVTVLIRAEQVQELLRRLGYRFT